MLAGLGSFAVRRRRLVLVGWLVVVVVGFALSGPVFDRLTSTQGGSDSESIRGYDLIGDTSPYDGQVVAVVDGAQADDPALAGVAFDLEHLGGVGRVRWPGAPGGTELVATDGDAVAFVVDLARDTEDAPVDRDFTVDQIESVLGLLQRDGVGRVLVGGDLLVFEEVNAQIQKDIARAEVVALPISLVVLILIFGGFVPAALPIVGAVAAVGGAFIGLLGFSELLDLDPNVVPVTTFMGLGLAIDYSLLMVSRFREERGAGRSVEDAVRRTTETAGRTILFSALTVATALGGLFAFAEPIFHGIAAAGVTVVLIAMFAALTLVTALLATLGHRVTTPTEPVSDEGRFARLARWVQRRPWPVALLTAAGLLLAGAPILGVTFANGGSELLPDSFESRQVDDLLAERFPGGGTDPVLVVSRADPADLQSWLADITPDLPAGLVAGVLPPTPLADGVSVLSVVPQGTSQGEPAKDLVTALRSAGPPGESYVTGAAAILVDFQASLASRAPWAFALVALATLILLFLMTGSLVVPVKALVMNTISLGATLGALVWIFADGHLEWLLRFEATGAIETWVPVLVFAFAFGLSMDYEVFLLARIKEAYDAQPAGAKDNDTAVRLGLQRSGRIITSAALLVVIVFLGFTTAQMLGLKQLGVALAMAVAVDATVVRCLLVPATMTLLGDRNWWAPGPLRRVYSRFGLPDSPAATAPAPVPVAAQAIVTPRS